MLDYSLLCFLVFLVGFSTVRIGSCCGRRRSSNSCCDMLVTNSHLWKMWKSMRSLSSSSLPRFTIFETRRELNGVMEPFGCRRKSAFFSVPMLVHSIWIKKNCLSLFKSNLHSFSEWGKTFRYHTIKLSIPWYGAFYERLFSW